MESFKRKVKIRILLVLCSIIALAFLFFALHFSTLLKTDAQQGFSWGFFMAAEVLLLAFLLRWLNAYRDPDALKRLYVAQTDERKIAIQQKSLSASFRIVVFSLAIGALVAGFLNFTVFITLAVVLLFFTLVKIGSMAYYTKKY